MAKGIKKKLDKVRVRKRGNTYSYAFEIGKVNGKRKAIERGGFDSPEEAHDAGVLAYNDWKNGSIGLTQENVTLSAFFRSWVDHIEGNIKPTTAQQYRDTTKRIARYIGDMTLTQLKPIDIDNMFRRMNDEGYSHATMQTARAILSNALNFAVYPAQLIPENPALHIKLPRGVQKVIKREIIPPDTLDRIHAEYPQYFIPCVIAYHTGARISEVLGLTWEDINLSTGQLSIRRQIVNISTKGNFFSDLKTEASARTIYVDSELIGILSDWKTRQNSLQANNPMVYISIYRRPSDNAVVMLSGVLETDYPRMNMICTRDDGKLIFRHAVSTCLRKLGINSHSFRHTHATLLVSSGAIPKAVSDRLGHKHVNITQDLYAKSTESMQKNVNQVFENLIKNGRQEQNADKKQT